MQNDDSCNPYESPLCDNPPEATAADDEDRSKQKKMLRLATSFLLLASILAYIICGTMHICMAGHMRHPPYPAWQYVNDAIWIAGIALGSILCLVYFHSRKKRTAISGMFLLFSRLMLGSGGGFFFILEIPLVVFVSYGAIVNLRSTSKAIFT